MPKQVILTKDAPAPFGTYSQAVKAGNTIYLSGQIGFDPQTMTIDPSFEKQTQQIFSNLKAVLKASGCDFSNLVRLNVYLTELSNFPLFNKIMEQSFDLPYPTRTSIGVKELPKGAIVEVDGIAVLSE